MKDVRAMTSRQLIIAAFALLTSLGLASRSQALECPMPQNTTEIGVIREPASEIARLSNLLAAGDLGNRISEIISDLRAKYPSVGSDELVNYLMTAYCPVVNGLSD
jgi:hypothetical protein